MTDQNIPDVTNDERRRARECAEFIKADMSAWGDGIRALARVFLNDIPAPTLPTLADMTREERRACRRMQCDVAYRSVRYVIAAPFDDDDTVALIAADGDICWVSPERVTPRPDLPRMEWPDTETPTPALPDGWRLADHKENGRVIVTNTTPDPSGHVCYVLPAEDYVLGYDWNVCDPDKLTYLDQEADQ